MAHAHEKRTQLRGLFVFQRLPMETACKKVGIPKSTGNRWKAEAKEGGDDWDTSRAAVALGDENFKQLSTQLLEDYLQQHKHTMLMLREATDLTPMQRATTLASMSDSFNKTMASFKRLSPTLNRQSIALDVMRRQIEFVSQHFPQHREALMEIVEPFGLELDKAYG